MDFSLRQLATRLAIAALVLAGCRMRNRTEFEACGPTDCYEQVAAEIDYPITSPCTECECEGSDASLAPWVLSSESMPSYRDLTLEEAIELGLKNSRVLRDLGGLVVRAPDLTRTAWDPAITETDAREGIEAALSEFDARFRTDLFFEKNNREVNNLVLGEGGILVQDLMNWDAEISKRAATGTIFSARHHIDYDANTAPGNVFDSVYNVWVEGEFRHPLMQGGGVEFNRIAGPTRVPGEYNGVLIARLNTDVALTQFEISVRNLVSNIENAYWDLYFAYRDLDAKIAARDAALDTWRKTYALFEAGRRGGEAEKEAQAREQFFRFQEEVQNAVTGRLIDGTRTNNGSMGGTFRGTGGVHVTERRLRLIIGLPASDGVLLRAVDEPTPAPIQFDWNTVRMESQERRAELRRQKWNIRRRELELIASKNHLLPRLDAVGRWRLRGFGKHLIGSTDVAVPPPLTPNGAYDQLTGDDYQDWQLGVELSMPIGFRRAHSAIRNADLRLARERAILCDQQREVVHQVADSVADVARAFGVSQTAYNRLVAGKEQLAAVQAAYEADKAPLDFVLDAQRRQAEAQSQYYRTLAEYAVATKNVHFTKGTLLEYNGVLLSEGPWPGQAYCDASLRESRRGTPKSLNYASAQAPIVSGGDYVQDRFGTPHVVTESPVLEFGTPTILPPTNTAPPEVPEFLPAGDDVATIQKSTETQPHRDTLVQQTSLATEPAQPATTSTSVGSTPLPRPNLVESLAAGKQLMTNNHSAQQPTTSVNQSPPAQAAPGQPIESPSATTVHPRAAARLQPLPVQR